MRARARVCARRSELSVRATPEAPLTSAGIPPSPRNRRKVLELGDAEEACMLADESDVGAVKLMASAAPRRAAAHCAAPRCAASHGAASRFSPNALRCSDCSTAFVRDLRAPILSYLTSARPPARPPARSQIGECFIDCAPSEAAEHVQRETDVAKAAKGALEGELKAAEARMAVLKKTLYARFGKSINLEE